MRPIAILILAVAASCTRREPQPPAPPPPPPVEAPAPALPPDAAPAEPDAAEDTRPAARAPVRKPKPAASASEPEGTGPGGATLGKIDVRGDLPKPEVERLLKGRMEAFRSCYERELAKNPGLEGRMLLELTVSPTGGVALADVKVSTLGGGEAEMCVGQLARDLRFKARPGAPEVMVSFPIEFRRSR